MSNEEFVLDAEVRKDVGKGASRRLRRRDDRVPAIIYGDEKDPENVSVRHKDIEKRLDNEAFYTQVIQLNVGDKSQDVILKDLQRHPFKNLILHADFMRVSGTKKLTTPVPVHFLNEEKCRGVKLQGGKISHNITELQVECLPKDLPQFIEVDLENLNAGAIIHISDLDLPQGVESVSLQQGTDHDLPVVTVNKPKGGLKGGGAESESEGED